MAKRVPQKPPAAYCEAYDEEEGRVVDGTRQSANIAARRSKSEIKAGEIVPLELASDSGYSSRTAATGASGQSLTSGNLGHLTINTSHKAVGPPPPPPAPPLPQQHRGKESRREKGKQREEKRASADMMHLERQRHANGMAAAPARSASKSRRRESVSVQPQQDASWEHANGFHNTQGMYPAAAVDPNAAYWQQYYSSHMSAMSNVPPASPQTTHFGYPYSQGPEVMIAHSNGRRTSVSSYHTDNRPMSFHAGMQDSMYNPSAMSMSQYERPPSVYSGYYGQPATPHQQYYTEPDAPFSAIYERSHTSSVSRPREKVRRSSIYGHPAVEPQTPGASFEEGSFLERQISREHRPRRASQSQRRAETYDNAEDFYRMPPPPPPQPKPKVIQSKTVPKIIQKRPELTHKAATTGSMPPPTSRRMSHSRDSWDMSDLKQTLPNQQVHKIAVAPERNRSIRSKSRHISYHESEPSRQIAVEDSRRRRRTLYDQEDRMMRDARHQPPVSDLEQKQRSAEEYQASKSGRIDPRSVIEDALRMKAKIAQRVESDSGSQKTRSNSSRGSDARTRDGSGVGSRFGDDNNNNKNNITLTLGGMTIDFGSDTLLSGNKIKVRTNDHGSIGVNIEGRGLRRPNRYIMPGGSDYASNGGGGGGGGRKEIEDGRRTRDERRSDRASRRSSRSTYSGRFD